MQRSNRAGGFATGFLQRTSEPRSNSRKGRIVKMQIERRDGAYLQGDDYALPKSESVAPDARLRENKRAHYLQKLDGSMTAVQQRV